MENLQQSSEPNVELEGLVVFFVQALSLEIIVNNPSGIRDTTDLFSQPWINKIWDDNTV